MKSSTRIPKVIVEQARSRAHDCFDLLWQNGYMPRDDAYKWLARAMGMTRDECHFRFFDLGLCEAAIVLVRVKLSALKRARKKGLRVRV